jgi:hypothetical protein
VLCAHARLQRRSGFEFTILPGRPIEINGEEIDNSRRVTDKLVNRGIESIQGRFLFRESGIFPHGAPRYTCTVSVVVTQGGRSGSAERSVDCWPHDESRESRRARVVTARGLMRTVFLSLWRGGGLFWPGKPGPH